MPLRILLILAGLFVGCVAIVALAWAIGSELYVFVPSRFRWVGKPPTHPSVVLAMLATCAALFLYSPRYALFFFTALLACLLLGSLVGYGVFAWKPTLMQALLTFAMIAETAYGWTIQDFYLED
jgi:hypothetical protein